ncbi:MAG TPA: fibronectin type III domain-containing protein, partial [Candidatus Deferrimicrobiaceae bacterium]
MKKFPAVMLLALLLGVLLTGCGGGGGGGSTTVSGGAGGGALPVVATLGAIPVTENSAVLNGLVTPNGLATEYWFQYGTQPAPWTFDNSARQPIGSGIAALPVNWALTNLAPGTRYFFRVCAVNSLGTAYSTVTNFTTSAPGAPPAVTTLAATSVSATAATLNGSIGPNGQPTDAWFEWGTSSSLATFDCTASQSVGQSMTNLMFSDG